MRFLLRLALFTALTFAVKTQAGEAPASYTNQCATCHGADGRGKTRSATKLEMPDLHSKKVQELSDSDLYESIARGAKHREYPHAYLYRGLKEQDIRVLVQYIRTLGTATSK